jgi:hypothetical protein
MDESKTDDEHIQYMLDGGDRGRIEQLYETSDAWGFGGGLRIHKEAPVVRLGDDVFQLRRRSEFYIARFDVSLGPNGLHGGDRRAQGYAVWFRRGSDPLRPQRRADRSLCGWVELEREADVTSWIGKLNSVIQSNLDRAGAPSSEEELDGAVNAHTQGTAAFLRGLGVPIPAVSSMDDLVDEVRKMDADSPVVGGSSIAKPDRGTSKDAGPTAAAQDTSPDLDTLRTATPHDKTSDRDRLRYVGNFVELGYEHHANPPSIVAARGKRVHGHKPEVLAYLRTARPISVSPGINQDYFDPTKTVRGETLRTDGVYLWPDYLADYVDRYDVALPEAFEKHMADNGWKLPDSLDTSTLVLPWK